ncbi:MAG: MBL fold metallo-hydrolase, partial [Alphaproteobacteria bacterium]|nr:MBL fold metallo-hydrolase [Alphaproteobacteria bacterium]
GTIIDEAPHGRLHLDGSILTRGDDAAVKERRNLANAGYVAVTIILDGRNRPAADPVVICAGLPEEAMEAARQAAGDIQDRMGRRFDDDKRAIEEIRRVVRRGVQDVWGKKPVVKVEIAHTG